MFVPILLTIESISDNEQRNAIAQLYDKGLNSMYTIALNILKNNYDAEDAVYDAFVNLIRHADKIAAIQLNDRLKLANAYARYAALHILRKRNGLTTVPFLDDSDEKNSMDIIDTEYRNSAEKIALASEQTALVAKAISSLPQTQRDLILLEYYYNYKVSEIARITGFTTEYISINLYRARRKLAEVLKDARP